MLTSTSLPTFVTPARSTYEATSLHSDADISQTETAQEDTYLNERAKLARILELLAKLRAMFENLFFKSKNENERAEPPLKQVKAINQQWQKLEDEMRLLTIDDESLIDEIDKILLKEINELRAKMAEIHEASTVSDSEDGLLQNMEDDLQTLENERQMSLDFLESIREELARSASSINSIEVNDEDYDDPNVRFSAALIQQAHQTLATPVRSTEADALFA